MISKQLAAITKEDLEALIADQVHESRTLDYKREPALQTGDEKRDLARDLSSFANAAGGDLIFGIEEAKDADNKNLGYPTAVPGFSCANFDALKLRIEAVAKDHVAPRIPGIGIHKIDGFSNGSVVIVRVPPSWIGPHMAALPGQSHFYSRTNSGNQPLDVQQIRAAFLGSAEASAGIRHFRDERLSRLVAGELSTDGSAHLLVHVIPVVSPSEPLDLHSLRAATDLFQPFRPGNSWNYRFNLDGFMVYSALSYTLAFRNGAIEGYDPLWVQPKTAEVAARCWPLSTETAVRAFVERSVRLLGRAGVECPVVVMLSLTGVRNVRFTASQQEYVPEANKLVDRDVLVLPEQIIEEGSVDLSVALRPLFDSLWQCSGWDRSPGYREDGLWNEERHRG